MQALHERNLLAAVAFVAATIVLSIQLINPSPVVVSAGESGTEVTELTGYFTYWDVGAIAIAAALVGSSGTYLTVGHRSRSAADAHGDGGGHATGLESDGGPTESVLEARRQEWEETADRLANAERTVYEAVLDADGVMAQSEIVAETDLSKASVSRGLDGLEAKQLVERKRRGMGNVVVLQSPPHSS